MIHLLFEIAQKDVKRQLVGTAASHNRDLYFQKFFEKINAETKYKIQPKEIITIYDLYRDAFYKAMKKEVWSNRLLKYLKRKGIKTGIITDSITYTQLKKMEILGISDDIDVLVTSEEVGTEKPHSGGFILACHKAGVLASESIMVGDNIERDIDGAQRVGMKGIWINRYHKKTKGIEAFYTVYTTKELYELLKKLL